MGISWNPLVLDNFGGVNYSGDLSKLRYNQSPHSYNYIPKHTNGKTSLIKRGGCLRTHNLAALSGGGTILGVVRYYDYQDVYHNIVKIDGYLYDVSVDGSGKCLNPLEVSGATDSVVSDVSFAGGLDLDITDNGSLYWTMVYDAEAASYIFSLYRDAAKELMIAQGVSGDDGNIEFSAVNGSGVSGSVNVQYSADDTDADNVISIIELAADQEVFFELWLSNYWFVCDNKLYMGSGGSVMELQFQDDDGVPLTGETPNGTVVIQHNQRLWWVGGNETPYYSKPDYGERYATRDDSDYLRCAIACDQNDGMPCVGGVSHFGKLLIFKRNKLFVILGDEALNNLEVTRYALIGAYNQKGILQCPDGTVRWYGSEGVTEYSDAGGLTHISSDIDDELRKIPYDVRDKVVCGWYDGLFLMFYSLDSTGSQDTGMAYDPRIKEWFPIKGWNISRFITFEDGTLYGISATRADILQLFAGYLDVEADIEAYRETAVLYSNIERSIDRFSVSMSNGTAEVWVSWNSDPETNVSGSIVKAALPALSDRLPVFMLSDEDAIGSEGDSILVNERDISRRASELRARVRPGNRFREIQFTFKEKSGDTHQIDYFMMWSFPTRELT